MNILALSLTDGSWLLWTLGMTVSVLSLHVGLEWVRQAQRATVAHQRWLACLVAGVTLGTGLCSAMVMALTGEVMDYAIGYDAWAATGLWLGGSLIASGVAACCAGSENTLARLACGLLLGTLAMAVQLGWMRAAGFQPGLAWHVELLAAAAPVVLAGYALGSWIALAAAQQDRRALRLLWTWGAAVVLAISLVAGEQLLLAAADAAVQTGSAHALELQGSMLTAICGVLVPLALVFMIVDIATRRGLRRQRRRRRVRSG